MDNALKETGQHQPNRRFRVNAGTAVRPAIEIRYLAAKPRQIDNLVNLPEEDFFNGP
jgi:hypothetical protein